MADIVARLKIDDKDYNAKLEKAKKSTREFSQKGATGVADIASKFTKLAGAVAASKAAVEVFNAAIKSSQTIGDEYTRVIESAKGSVSEFIYAMANADFSGFNNGLKGIVSNAREAASAMDSLGNAQISFDYLTAGYRSDFKTSMGLAKDKSLSMGERKAAYEASLGSLDKIGEAVKVYTDKAIAAVVSNAAAKGNNIDSSFITRSNIDRVFALDITAGGEEEKARLAKRYKEFKKLKKLEEKLERAVSVARTNGYEAEATYAQQLADVRTKIHSDDYQMAALYNAMLVKGTDEWLKGLADIVVKADNANSAYQELKTSSLEVANQLNKPIKSGAVGAAIYPVLTGNVRTALASQSLAAPIGSSVSKMPDTLAAIEPVILYADAYKVLEETSLSASEGLSAISSAMGSIAGVMDEGSAAWMNYASGIISAVSSALPSLQALATAQAAAAATGAALNPWTAIAGVAAVASIGAALANLPKFAQGGVVGGNSYFGDKMLIRVNSGERVLTREQNAAYERGAVNGKVEFVIRDSVLYGILNRGNAYNSRAYHGS